MSDPVLRDGGPALPAALLSLRRALGAAALVAVGLFSPGCGDDPALGHHAAAVAGPTLAASAASYAPGQTVTVSWSGLPGNATDWIGLAPAGADVATVDAWAYTGGAAAGSYAFTAGAAGSYVARAFSADSYTQLVESAAFTVAASTATVAVDAATYSTGQTITATWTGLPGAATDWIALVPAGAAGSAAVAWAYTGGAAAGSHAFAGVAAAGSYVVRAFPSASYVVAAESAFTVTAPAAATVTTDATAYGASGTITVTWSGLPGDVTDWIGLAPAGAAAMTVTRWVYTGGQAGGSYAFSVPAAGGAYVARAFVHDSYDQVGESAAFAVGVDLTTDKASYATTEQVTVTWANLPGNATDWIAIAPAGSALTAATAWRYTSGAVSGAAAFGPLAAGTYVARAFLNNTYTLMSESAAFTVAGTAITVSTSAATYAAGADITVSWTNLPGHAHDWIALAPQGAAITTAIKWVYTGGATAGSTTFSGGLASAGTYEARAFDNDTYTLLGTSTAFVVQ